MSTVYPGTVDVFTNPSGTQTVDVVDHALQHTNANTAVIAVENVLGTTSGTSIAKNFNAGDFAVRQNAGGTFSITMTGTLNSAVLGTPLITAGSFASVKFGTQIANVTSTALTAGQYLVFDGTTFQGSTVFLGARVKNSAVQNSQSGSVTDLSWDTVVYDTGTFHGTANPTRLTAQVAGYYRITGDVVFLANGTGNREANITPNGSLGIDAAILASTKVQATTAETTICNVTTDAKMNAGDYVELIGIQESGGTLGIRDLISNFSIYKIG